MKSKIVTLAKGLVLMLAMVTLQACFERQYYSQPEYGYGPAYYQQPVYAYQPVYRPAPVYRYEAPRYESRQHEAREEREEHEEHEHHDHDRR